jgi:lipopolysaccharide transport system permease protein
LNNEENWDLVIKPKRKILEIPIREIIRYRDLIFLFVKRDFTTQYKQTLLGPLWFVISPFFSTVIYTFIFGRLANIGTDGIPHTLFYFSGTILWTFFSNCFNESCNVFINNAGIFGKVYFPRLVVPINFVLSNSIKSLIQFLMLVILFIYFIFTGSSIHVSWLMILFPLVFIWLAAIAVGAGIIISSITTKYRDLRNIVGFALNLGMYATPVVYPISEIPERFRWIAYANPVSAPIELFRKWFFGISSIDTNMILISLGVTALFVFIGLILFNQNEQSFIDVI